MNPTEVLDDREPLIRLSPREAALTAALAIALAALIPFVPFRPRAATIEPDYRIPFALSTRYELYQRFTTLASSQVPGIVVGDSVAWGQCAVRAETLSHHLNSLAGGPRFANAGLDGMHPLALAGLLEHHAPGLRKKDVLLQFDPLWLMSVGPQNPAGTDPLANHPALIPRLAATPTGSFTAAISRAARGLAARTPLKAWGDALDDARFDFLAWSLDHPYESPLRVITSPLPSSEDSHPLQLHPWNEIKRPLVECTWAGLDNSQWTAFERILRILEQRGNRIRVLVGPMNEHMLSPGSRASYQSLKRAIEERLKSRGVESYVPPVLESEHYGDICHPLGAGYEELARLIRRDRPAWLLLP